MEGLPGSLLVEVEAPPSTDPDTALGVLEEHIDPARCQRRIVSGEGAPLPGGGTGLLGIGREGEEQAEQGEEQRVPPGRQRMVAPGRMVLSVCSSLPDVHHTC